MHFIFYLGDSSRIWLILQFNSDVKSGLSLPRKSVVRLTDRPDMTLDVYRGRRTTMQQQQQRQIQGRISSYRLAGNPMIQYIIINLNTIYDY